MKIRELLKEDDGATKDICYVLIENVLEHNDYLSDERMPVLIEHVIRTPACIPMMQMRRERIESLQRQQHAPRRGATHTNHKDGGRQTLEMLRMYMASWYCRSDERTNIRLQLRS